MSKRDEDSQPNEMEAGMTTAERRRRRRRGGGLRVPSDNVPRSRTPSAPPPPVPEDPALAMSIAYSFRGDESGPVPRVVAKESSAPVAPEAIPTVIDPPSDAVSEADFEMKTREMSSVDLQALGMEDANAASTLRMERVSAPIIEALDSARANSPDREEVDVEIEAEPPEMITQPQPTLPPPPSPERKPPTKPPPLQAPAGPAARLKTVALSDDDLEEVRAASQPVAPAAATTSPGVAPAPSTTKPPPLASTKPAAATPVTLPDPPANRTMQLQAIDMEEEVEVKRPASEEPMSVPEIDIQELAASAGDSGDIPIDVDEKPAPTPPRPRAASQPPPIGEAAARAAQDGDAFGSTRGRKSGAIEAPPPPPPAHKAPPAPPPAAKKPAAQQAAVVAVATKEPSKPTSRTKPWFVDLFDEDYLRTLPFLTPQATQAEAEFVIDTMNLASGAQVLDVGCGYGRHAMELAARGFHVVGLDLSTPLLVRGGEEAHRRGLTINFIRGDMRELDFENQFDGAYCVFSTFGYFDDETNKKALVNIARALKPGGKVLIEILNRDYVIADLPTRVWWEGDGCVVLEEVELNYFSSRIQVNRSVVFDDGRQVEQEISVRAYSLHEVGKLMHAAGFRVLEVSGGYQTRGRFFGNQSRHIIVLAERKEPSGT
ncbi:MAG TPA: methyltransferase domain-containing protein [Kofleriaceae bacterium]|nr:methyltransferase domain-containing protein [Kofleriaceae bacterium]